MGVADGGIPDRSAQFLQVKGFVGYCAGVGVAPGFGDKLSADTITDVSAESNRNKNCKRFILDMTRSMMITLGRH